MPATAQTDGIVLSHEAWEEYRALYLSDPWDFALDVCGFDRLVERFHKPLIYLFTHQTALLIDLLKGPLRSAVITKIKAALKRKGLKYADESDFAAIHKFTRKLNIRVARKHGKTSCGEAAILWDITVDPHQEWALISRDDPSAHEMCKMIGKIIRSPAYRFFFPDRIPERENENITQTSILLAGRTRTRPQPCVTAGGVGSGWTSMHFTRIYNDDLTGLENKSETKLKVVRDFQANAMGLRVPEFTEEDEFLDWTTGTRWARKDDSWILDTDENCLTIYVPAEERTEPVTFSNMLDVKPPTLPEWFSEEKLLEEKKEYLKEPDLGPVALLANLFLTIAADGAKVFNDAIVDARQFHWIEDDGRRYVARLEKANNPQSRIVKFEPRKLERKAGADPSASMTGDQWAVSVLGRDPAGTHYQLHTRAGRGTEQFLNALLYIDDKWDPDQIGIEKDAMQLWVLVAISKDYRFQTILHKFVPVSTSQKSKQARAERFVAAPLEMGQLYLNPDDRETPQEMKEWDPDNKNAKDARIDSIGNAMVLYTTPAAGMTSKEVEEMAALDNEKYRAAVDPDFGFPVENVMAEEDFFLDDFDGDFEDDLVAY